MTVDDAWVVFKCNIGSREHFWAWCRPSRYGPGFDDIYYYERDGRKPWSPSGDELPVLGEHLFTVVFPPLEGDVPTGTRFPQRDVAPAVEPHDEWRPAPPLEAAPDAGSA